MTPQKRLATTVGLLLLSATALAPPSSSDEALLDRRVPIFETHSNARRNAHFLSECCDLQGMLFALAMHANVRICFEGRPLPRQKQPHLDLRVTDKTVGDILQMMLRKHRQYEYRERLGVIEVFPVGADKDRSDCLNMTVPALHVHYPWKLAWGAVRCEILLLSAYPGRAVSEPMSECSGASHMSHPPEEMLEANFDNQTIRDILDQLSSMAGNAAWYANYDGPSPSCKNLVLGEYQPLTWYPPEKWNPAEQTSSPWTEGLPKGCLTCHYHSLRPVPR